MWMRALVDVLNYRFDKDSSLSGHSVGNLVLAALTSIHKDLGKAIRELSLLLNTKHKKISRLWAPFVGGSDKVTPPLSFSKKTTRVYK